jgi:hypothetical protein
MQEQARTLMEAVSIFKLKTGNEDIPTTTAKPITTRLVAHPAPMAPRKWRDLVENKEKQDSEWNEY